MKVKNTIKPYAEVAAMKRPEHRKPQKTNIFFRTLLKAVSVPDLLGVHFKCKKVGMERLSKKEPCLILMNHSSFIDLEIASSVLYPRPFNIVATLDAFIGREWLMYQIGCIPTRKFVLDLGLVRDITHCIRKLKTSVLMYPEAGYTFDGTATTMPESLAKFVKMLGAPLVMLETQGAFHRQPLYNELKKRKVRVSAELRYVLSADEIKEMSVDEISDVITKEFSFDAFRWQQENKIRIDEPDRAVGLDRLLYKCPKCGSETGMHTSGAMISCSDCGKSWELDEYGYMWAKDGETEFSHIPDWYAWERKCVAKEIAEDKYGYKTPVDIYMIVNASGVYKVGSGVLEHTKEGFHLTGCDGQIDYKQNSVSLYTLNSDYYWYCLGDVIGLGNQDALYYCMPTKEEHIVTKSRLATEEIYKTVKNS